MGPQIRSAHILIGRATEHVQIEVTAQHPDGWRTATVEVICGAWAGAFRWQFLKGELRTFGSEVEQLYQRLTGSADLNPMHSNLELRMTGDGRGHVSLKGKARSDLDCGVHLVFQFELDQTELPAIAASLAAADTD
jgi:hypothetical protein